MSPLTLQEARRRDAAIRAYFAARDWAGGEFGLKRQVVMEGRLPQYPLLLDDEWEVIDGMAQFGCGDLVLTDGRGHFAVVEFKVMAEGAMGGRRKNVRGSNRKKLRKMEEQSARYAGAVYRSFDAAHVDSWLCWDVQGKPTLTIWGRLDKRGWHPQSDFRDLGLASEDEWWKQSDWYDQSTALADHVALLKEIVEARDRVPESKVCLFATQQGRAWEGGGLMVVGRAVNGWRNRLVLAEPINERTLEELALSELLSGRATQPCAMQWVQKRWGTGAGYRTSRSAFWRVARATALDLGEDEVGWVHEIAWSNLYRVAPSKTGNPSGALSRLQLERCVAFLKADVQRLKPGRLLVLAGMGWFAPFAEALGLQLTRREGGVWNGQLDDTQVVVAPHPQGKREGPLVAAIAAAWQCREEPGG